MYIFPLRATTPAPVRGEGSGAAKLQLLLDASYTCIVSRVKPLRTVNPPATYILLPNATAPISSAGVGMGATVDQLLVEGSNLSTVLMYGGSMPKWEPPITYSLSPSTALAALVLPMVSGGSLRQDVGLWQPSEVGVAVGVLVGVRVAVAVGGVPVTVAVGGAQVSRSNVICKPACNTRGSSHE